MQTPPSTPLSDWGAADVGPRDSLDLLFPGTVVVVATDPPTLALVLRQTETDVFELAVVADDGALHTLSKPWTALHRFNPTAFPRLDAVTLAITLADHALEETTDADARALARRCGYLPVMLESLGVMSNA